MKVGRNLIVFGNNGLVAAWHWHWSRTWRWGLWVRKPKSKGFHVGRFKTYGGKGVRLWVRTPLILVSFIKQPNQPYRECL